MVNKIQAFRRKVRTSGVSSAVLSGVAFVLPSPYSERVSFTKTFVGQLSEAPRSWRLRYRLWKQGFSPKAQRIYDFQTYSPKEYVSTYDVQFASNINKPSAEYAHNKQKFYELLEERGYEEYIPERYGTLSRGILIGSGVDLLTLLDREGMLVMKDKRGAAGKRVHIFEAGSEGYRIDGETVSERSLRECVSDSDGYIVTEYCHQSEYARSIYPSTPNTIRLVTMHPDDGKPFVARAVHRIGTRKSESVDNFSQGGLSAEIRNSGTLGRAVRYLDGEVSWHSCHPDTDAQIEGVVIPGWERLRETVLSAAADIPELRYVGWDIIVTGEGSFKIIEGNSNTDTDLLQAHGPLLSDNRVRQFYRNHSAIADDGTERIGDEKRDRVRHH